MNESLETASPPREDSDFLRDLDERRRQQPVGVPSNAVYERVGDTVLRAAQEGVRTGMQPQDIIRDIIEKHHVHLNVGELRLLLASRRLPA
ncbi:MAG: hypothetical protein NVS2B16_30220 [Chloroflexota bacterium]